MPYRGFASDTNRKLQDEHRIIMAEVDGDCTMCDTVQSKHLIVVMMLMI